MNINDLDKSLKEERKQIQKSVDKQASTMLYISVLFFIIALVFTVLTYFIVAQPAPIWMFVVTGGCWLVGSIIKWIDKFSLGIYFGLFNVFGTILIYCVQYGII